MTAVPLLELFPDLRLGYAAAVHLTVDDVAAFIATGLPTEEHAQLAAHIDTCDDCRRMVSAIAGGEPAQRPLAAGDVIDKFVLRRSLGAGGMGEVWAARDEELGRDVALKFLRVRRGSHDTAVLRMRREAQAMARLAHPNVVAVYELVETVDGRVCCVMQLVEGANLRTWLESPRSAAARLAVARDAGHGLAAAHAAGLVHRDIKPENILVTREGRALVADFGLAKVDELVTVVEAATEIADAHAATVVAHGTVAGGAMIIGTPRYMSPEQLAGADVDARSDQFSYALTMHELLFGNHPFPASSIGELPDALARAPAAPAKSDVPKSVLRAVRRGLAIDPAHRWPSIAALVDAMQPRRRVWWIAGGLAAAAIAVFVLARSPASTAPPPVPPALAAASGAATANPTLTFTTVRAFVDGPHWQIAHAALAGAVAAGVPWQYTLASEPRGVVFSSTGRVLVIGDAGALTLIDLESHAQTSLAALATPTDATFLDDTHVLLVDAASFTRIDLATDTRVTFPAPGRVVALDSLTSGAIFATADGRAWTLRGDTASPLALAGTATKIRVSDDREQAAIGGSAVWRYDGTQVTQLAPGAPTAIAFESGTHRIVTGAPDGVTRYEGSKPEVLANSASSRTVAISGDYVFASIEDFSVASDSRVIRSDLEVVRGARAFTIRPPTKMRRLFASPASPFLLGAAARVLYAWNLDGLSGRHFAKPSYTQVFAMGLHDLVISDLSASSTRIDLATGKTEPARLPPGARPIVAVDLDPSRRLEVVREVLSRRLYTIRDGGALELVAEEVAAAVPIDPERIVIADTEHAVMLRSGETTRVLAKMPAPIKRVEATAQWVLVTLADGTRWRYALATGVAMTLKEPLAAPFSSPAPDGSVWFAHGKELVRWHADGSRSTRTLAGVGEITAITLAGRTAWLSTAGAGYLVALDRGEVVISSPMTGLVGSVGVFTVQRADGSTLAVTHDGTASWTVPTTCTTDNPCRLTQDGRFLYSSQDTGVYVWPLELPVSPAETIRWANQVSNAR